MTKIQKDNKNVAKFPNLRFPGFEGEWEERKLGEIGDVKMCKRIFNDETTTVGEIPFFKIGSFGKEADAFISQDLYTDYKTRFSFPKKGDILISAAGTIGRTVVYDGNDAYFQDSNIVWIANDNTLITNNFLYYILQIVKYNTEGGTIQRLYNNVLKSTKFNTPSISEQTKISSFLSLIDKRIATQNKIIEQLKTLIKGLSEKLFSQKIRFKGFMREWELKSLGEIGEIITGKTPSTKDLDLWNGDIQFVTPTDITDNKYQHSTERTIKKADNLKILPQKSIMFTCIASIGKMSLSLNPCVTNQQINSVIPHSCFDSEFLFYAIKNISDYIKSTQSSSTLPIINKTEFSKFKILIPSIDEQTRISIFLSSIDEKIETEKSILDKYHCQKQYLLQNLFI
ncbi:restriction endonuclease subunit S [Chryseobacterium sp. T1]